MFTVLSIDAGQYYPETPSISAGLSARSQSGYRAGSGRCLTLAGGADRQIDRRVELAARARVARRLATCKEKPNTMMTVPAALGVCTLILLGAALSACADTGGNTGGRLIASNDAFCQPGICVGSTGTESLPSRLRYFVR